MLVIEKLKKALAPFVLEIPRLEIQKGETFVLLGPTGAGKSSFLELLAGFSQPDEGRILVDGSDVTELPARSTPYLDPVPGSTPVSPSQCTREHRLWGQRHHPVCSGD